jgi:hypothetical protein
MADPYDYTGRDGRGNDKLWHEEDEDEPEYDDMMSTYDDQTELED